MQLEEAASPYLLSYEATQRIWNLLEKASEKLNVSFEDVVRTIQGEGAERILSQAFTQYELCSYCYKLERGINEILDRYFKDNGLNAEAGLLSLSPGPITSLREFRVRLLQAAVTVTCRKWSLL